MHIMQAIERLQTYAGSLSRDELETDVLRYYGIVKNIEIIGEAVNMLSFAFKEAHCEVAWRDIAGMRNFWCMNTFAWIATRFGLLFTAKLLS